MRTTLALAALCVALTGCASGNTTQLLQNLQGCSRTYQGNVGGLGLGQGIAVTIQCEPNQGVTTDVTPSE